MTCIVGLEYEDGVIIGGDSAAVAERQIQITTTPKVFKLASMLIGYTWSFRMGQIIQYSLKDVPLIPKKTDSNYRYLINDFVPFLRDIFKDAGWLTVKDNKEEGGQFLIGIRGQLFEIDSNFAVLRMSDGYSAVGSGAPYALGTLYTLKAKVNEFSNIIEPPSYIVELALQAAAHYSTSVSAPFIVEKLNTKDA